jgi:O-antigen/teichoic acid export membrane protein
LPKAIEPEVATVDSVFKPTVVLMCGRTVAFGAAFFIPVLLTRILIPEQYGTYKQVFLIYATFYGIAQLGMAESLFYFLPRDPGNAGRYVLNAVLILFAAGFGCLSLLVSQEARLSQWLNNGALSQYIPLLAANLLFMVASAPLEIALVSRKRYRWAAWSYASDLVRVIFFLVPILLWRDLRALLAGGLVFAMLRFCAALFYFRREFGSDLLPSGARLKEQFAYALPFELAVLVETAQVNFHQYAVSHYFDAAAFAVYSVGCLQIPLIEFFASPAGNVMMVLMTERRRQRKHDAVVTLWHDTTRKLALVFFPVAALLITTARDLLPFLFTDRYRASIPIFMIWMATVGFSALQTDAVLRVFAATRFLLLLNIIRLMVVAGLIYVLLPRFGILGAVLSTVLATGVAKALALARIRRLMAVAVSALLPWRRLTAIAAVSALACAGPLAVRSVVPLSAFSLLAISGLSYVAIYCECLWRFHLLSASERSAVATWLSAFAPAATEARAVRNLSEG